jgi:trans-aconitate 2-methyltransferase
MDSLDWNPKTYAENSSAQEDWGSRMHAKLSLKGDETLADIGCGDGRLTARLAARLPRGQTIGIDLSPAMVEHARLTWRGLPGLEFRQADARSFTVEEPVDILVSNAVLHWIPDLAPVFRASKAALKPGGRLLFQMGGTGNVAQVEAAANRILSREPWKRWFDGLPSVWFMHSPQEAERELQSAGLAPVRAELLERDMSHEGPGAMLGWMRATWFSAVSKAPEDMRERLLHEILTEFLAENPSDVRGRTHVRMVRLEVEALAPTSA